MSYLADLHIHSSYAYATSKALTLENLASWARFKGLDLLATADFTHPRWFAELESRLSPAGGDGLYEFDGVRFVLGTEVSCVYRQGGRVRRIHVLLFAPGLEAAARLNRALAAHGKLGQDGRPTLTMSARDLTALVLDLDPACLVIPAHAWTPWYGVFGSKSGFDSLEECFLDLTPAIAAVETGLSSDPAMNWGVPELRNRAILSFSDAHSLPKLAREATAFNGPLTYAGLAGAIAANDVAFTVELYPEEGKYHYDGHRKCGVSRAPDFRQTERLPDRDTCPVCRKTLTLGVLHRVMSRTPEPVAALPGPDGFVTSPDGRPPFIRLVPLQELVSQVLGKGVATQQVQRVCANVVRELGGELTALIKSSFSELASVAGEAIAAVVLQARVGDILVEPGFDGVFGKVSLAPAPDGPVHPIQPALI